MIVKLKSTKGADIYVNPDHIAVLSPSNLVNQSSLMLQTGLALEIDEPAKDVARKFGFDEGSCLTI